MGEVHAIPARIDHPLLARQLRRAELDRESPPGDASSWGEFLSSVARTYTQADLDRAMIERSLRISSDEMRLLHDAMERRNTELELSRVAAEAANASKSQFLANMSHEIRTPMNAILGFVDLLLESVCPDGQRLDYGQTIRRNAQHLLTVIDDILDFSKIESGHLSLERTPVDVGVIIEEVRSLMSVRAIAKGLEFRLDAACLAGVTLASDPVRLRQVILNLVSNAVKFTASGSVTISASCTPAAGGMNHVRIEVCDTGIGLSDAEIDSLFQAFNQADTSTTRRYGGTGLGLAISRRLAMLLGGDIEVKSVPGKGSAFVFWFNAPREESSKVPAAASGTAGLTSGGLEGKRVLLVEDGLDNQRLISHHLTKAGAIVTLAENGLMALEAVAASPRAFDVILMDMQMPVMDGYTATATLRAKGIRTPIVALTAHAMSSDRQKCLGAGCDDYCTKPINKAALLAMCEKWIVMSSPSWRGSIP